MMTPTSLYSLLKANSSLTSLVGLRIWPVRADSQADDYIVWQRIGAQPIETLNEPTAAQFDLVQFSVFSSDYSRAETICNALVSALDGVALSTGDSPTLQSRRDAGWDDTVERYRQDADFLI